MTDFWYSEEAEKRLGEVMHRALTNAPQTVLGPDCTAVVVMSEADHYRLVLAHQRLLALGETPPVPRQLQEGEKSAWDHLQSLPPSAVYEDGELPGDYFERMREEDRRRERCACRNENDLSADAAD
ncbi:MAG TPA: hypothetical protein VF647_26555 [Longimicrobium sp.]|jgi:hypothetical protein